METHSDGSQRQRYVNIHAARTKPSTAEASFRTYRLIGVCFGLLFILQVVLNVTLRLLPHITVQRDLKCNCSIPYDLQSDCSDLLRERDQLLEEKNHLQKKYDKMLAEMQTPRNHTGPRQLCPRNWAEFGHSCYFVTSGARSWYESQLECESQGADLVIVNSIEEQEFINTLIRSCAWIGLSSNIEGWRWVDGTPLSERYWQYHPHLYEACLETCAYTAADRPPSTSWNHNQCGDPLLAVCEKKKPKRSEPS